MAHDRGCPRDGGVGEDDPADESRRGHGDPPRHYHQRLRGCRVHVKSTNMGTYVYEKLDAIPEEIQAGLMDELSDVGLVNCWYIAGLLYKVKFQSARPGRARYQLGPRGLPGEARRHRGASRGERGGFSLADPPASRDDYADDEDGRAAKARRRAALVASAAGSGVRGEAANVPGVRSSTVPEGLLPVAQDVGVWFGRVVLRNPASWRSTCRCTFAPTTPWRGSSRSPRRRRTRTCCSITEPPYLESDMPPADAYPSRRTPGGGRVPCGGGDAAIPPFDTLVDYLGPGTRGVRGKGWRDGGRGDEFLTFILFRDTTLHRWRSDRLLPKRRSFLTRLIASLVPPRHS